MQPSARDLDLRQRHGVETPEHVDVHFELAGVGSRLAAALLDLLLMLLALVILAMAFDAVVGQTGRAVRGWLAALMWLLVFLLVWGYFTLFEALNGGRTPGKQALGIRVVMDTGRPITPAAAVIRNLVRILDTYFVPPLLPALLTIFLHRTRQGRSSFVIVQRIGRWGRRCRLERRRNRLTSQSRQGRPSSRSRSSGCWTGSWDG